MTQDNTNDNQNVVGDAPEGRGLLRSGRVEGGGGARREAEAMRALSPTKSSPVRAPSSSSA